jgi:hypothetical protein
VRLIRQMDKAEQTEHQSQRLTVDDRKAEGEPVDKKVVTMAKSALKDKHEFLNQTSDGKANYLGAE